MTHKLSDPHNSSAAPATGLAPAALAHLAALVPGIRLALVAVIGSVVIAALYFGRQLLIPLALAILLGFLLDPPVQRLRRWGLPRMGAVLLVVSVVLAGVVGLGAYMTGQLASLSESLPRYQHTMQHKLRELRRSVEAPGMWDGLRHTWHSLQQEVEVKVVPGGASGVPESGSAPVERPRVAPAAARRAASAEPAAPAAGPEVGELQRVQVVPAAPAGLELLQLWLLRLSGPVVTGGIVLLFVILILLDRDGLRDRLLRLAGGNINLATDALDEATRRIGKYLRMQLIVNATYGIPLAVGLWLIGVPGALLWGVLAALLRYIPYAGPVLAAVFPLTLAFAVGDGWSMLLWTLALVALLELVSNNVIEPWLYGESTGLSTLAIIVSAAFWTALWGPIGLILATPLSVCLLVLGRSIPALRFLDVLLGSEPVLTPSQRLYQRLLVGNETEALALAQAAIRQDLPQGSSRPRAEADGQSGHDVPSAVVHCYDALLFPALRLYSQRHTSAATASQRYRFNNALDELLEALALEYPPAAQTEPDDGETAGIHCLGVRWEVDAMAAQAMAHGLRLYGYRCSSSPQPLGPHIDWHALPNLDRSSVVCLAVFSPQPQARIRQLCRQLRRRWPHLRIVVGVWNAPQMPLTEQGAERVHADHLVDRLHEMVMRVHHLLDGGTELAYIPAATPANEPRRLEALRSSGLLQAPPLELFEEAVRRASNAFDVPFAQVSLVDAQWVHAPASSLVSPAAAHAEGGTDTPLPRAQSTCAYVVRDDAPFIVEDAQSDPRFARNPALLRHAVRFYAGVPLRSRGGQVIGVLCVMDQQPHEAASVDVGLLERMAAELMLEVRKAMRKAATNRDARVSDASDGAAGLPAAADGLAGKPQPG